MASGCATAPETISVTPDKTRNDLYAIKAGPFRYVTSKDMFAWPIKGDIVSFFGARTGRVMNKGIDIKAWEGMNVRAARTGRIVYCNSYFKGFGKTLIIDHGNGYQTVYAYNSDILVKVGDEVRQNDIIAKAGRTGRAKEPTLHFEIRRDGEPQNPYFYLPH